MTETQTIVISRFPLYAVKGRQMPGAAWRWTYTYTVDNGPVAQYGTNLTSLRAMLKKFYPGAKVTQTW